MQPQYEMVKHFKEVIVTNLSPGGDATISDHIVKKRRSVEDKDFHYKARTTGVNVSHDVVLEIPNNQSVQQYQNGLKGVENVLTELQNCQIDCPYNITTKPTVVGTEINKQALCDRALENSDFAKYYSYSEDLETGVIFCINRCDARHPNHKICKNLGLCTLFRDVGEVCKCQNVDSIWYLGSNCDMPIHRTAFYAGLSVTLAVMLVTVGALAAYAVINKHKQTKNKDMKQKLVNEWLDDDFQWSRPTSPSGTHGASYTKPASRPLPNMDFQSNLPMRILRPETRTSWDA
ncbi:mucin-3A [Girardinichthys multiradiatus]|uniref:mucin-3A n=1 Tax=Girardinichthys multiradiatus TaxID=208333 RepID=UPI001FACD531|nr:mucin-3A [Girardinichthys multiradiatus]